MSLATTTKRPPFIHPIERVEIEGRKRHALLRQQKTRCSAEEFERKTRQLLEEEQVEIHNARHLVQTIGSGCECQTQQRNLDVEPLFESLLPNLIAQLICSYLPVGSTPEIHISDDQEYVLKIIASGYNVFFTGDAGTGKSFILKQLRDFFVPGVAFTALTGIAAINVHGSTLHSFGGLGRGEGTKEALLATVKRSHKATLRWRTTQCLVVDEVSMLSATLFESIDYVARNLRGIHEAPFGGMQLVFCGDFGQLPPVKAKYCFESPLWNLCFPKPYCVRLTQIYRQKDPVLTFLLNEIRFGKVTPDSMHLLCQLARPLCEHDGIVPTILKSLNEDVSETNKQHLLALGNDTKDMHTYVAYNSGSAQYFPQCESLCNADPIVELRPGAQVMLVKNMEIEGYKLVNGSKGVVLDITMERKVLVQFCDCPKPVLVEVTEWPYEELRDGEPTVLARRHQMPLKLAWCTTIHKSQGLTLDRVSVDLTGIFQPAMGYVALSRAKSLRGMQVIGSFTAKSFQANECAMRFSQQLITVREFQTNHNLLIKRPQHIWNTKRVKKTLKVPKDPNKKRKLPMTTLPSTPLATLSEQESKRLKSGARFVLK